MSEQKSDSEERKLPPTENRLREARKKGQIPHCPDLVNAATLSATIAYLWLSWPAMIEKLQAIMILSANTYSGNFDEAKERLMDGAYELGQSIILPLLLIVMVTSVITNIAIVKGLLFSFEPIKPNASKINPANGFKKIFALRTFIELIKSILKTVLIFAIVLFLSRFALDTILKTPYCGVVCVSAMFGDMMSPIVIIINLIFILLAICDIGTQRWIFLRDTRMTLTEWKREHKDIEGDPLIKHNRKQRRHELINTEGVVLEGMRHATFVITDRSDVLVGLHFVKNVTPSPVVVCKGYDQAAHEYLQEARQRRLIVHDNPELARAIAQKMVVGGYIDEELFHSVAEAMILSGAI